MKGPFPKPADLCKSLAASLPSSAAKTKKVDCVPASVGAPPAGLAIDKLMLLVLKDAAMPDASVHHLALHTSAGWFYDPDGEESFTDAAMMKRFKTDAMPVDTSFYADGSALGAKPGVRVDFDELTVAWTIDPSSGKTSKPSMHSVRSSSVVCAVGASGVPSCLDPLRGDPAIAAPNGAAPPSPPKVPFAPKDGKWTVDAAAHLSMLRDAGHFDTHQDVPLAGDYALVFE